MNFRELEKIVKADGWRLKNVKGSHHHYVHPLKPGKVSIPCHKGDMGELLTRLGVTSAPDLPLSLAGFCNLLVYSAFTPEPAPVGRSLHLR
jgi:predicted RNA binding protein YcfA (HicA-like mRNA interferase family)